VQSEVTFEVHPSEETLEEYCFNRLSEPAIGKVEEHILVCVACQETLQVLDEYILLMKAATAEYKLSRPPGFKERLWAIVPRLDFTAIRANWARNGLALAAAALFAVALFSWREVSMRSEPDRLAAATVPLAALRGGGEVAARAPAGRPLDLAIDVTDLGPSKAYRLEVVNAAGQLLWGALASPSNGKLFAQVPKGLKPGVYWVHLSSPNAGLLREFSLRLE
jgi:hypothetical protein